MASVLCPPTSSASSTNTEIPNEVWSTTPIMLNLPVKSMDKPTSPSFSTFPTKIPNQILYQSKPRNFSLPLSKVDPNIPSLSPPLPPVPDSSTIVSAPSATNQAPRKEEPLDGLRKFFRKRSISFGLKKGGQSSKNRLEGESASRVSTASDETIPSVPSTPDLFMPLGRPTMGTFETDEQIIQPDQAQSTIKREANCDGISRVNSGRNAQSSLVISTALNETFSTFSFPPPNATSPGPSAVDVPMDEPISPRTTFVGPQHATAPEHSSITQPSQSSLLKSILFTPNEEPTHNERQSLASTSPSSSLFSDELEAEIRFGQAKKLEWSPSEGVNGAELWPSSGKEDTQKDDVKDDDCKRCVLPNLTSMADVNSDCQPSPLDPMQSPPGSLSWSVSSDSSECLESPLTTTSSSIMSSGPGKKDVLFEGLVNSPEQASFTSLVSSAVTGASISKEHKINHSVPDVDDTLTPFVPLDLAARGLGISILNDDYYEYTSISPLATIRSSLTEGMFGLYHDAPTSETVGERKERFIPRQRSEPASDSYHIPHWKLSSDGEGLNEEEDPLEFDAAVWPMPPLREVWVEKQSGRKNSLLVTPLEETFEYFPSSGVPLQARERPRRSSL
ncbi:hypothetical protein [Phaffia rhodozyma]|uniref:Uncharacterized protein n=1 Tax=Phaffia rhodozyma TaxID=264483 RepID=A0A0F7SWG8_PHARH|nr:hypothetical protein [Phaffia rhodozyma]